MLTCKRFARHVAGAEPIDSSMMSWIEYWLHWVICPFCRRYWREIREVGRIQRRELSRMHWRDQRLSDFKKRLKQKLSKRTSL